MSYSGFEFLSDIPREYDMRALEASHAMLWCPTCTNNNKDISAINSPANRMKQIAVRDKSGYIIRYFWGCTNYPTCKFSASDGRGALECLNTYDLDALSSGAAQVKIHRAAQQVVKKLEPEFAPVKEDTDHSIEIKLLQSQFIMLVQKIEKLEQVNAELKKRLDENEERRKNLGLEVF